MLVSLSSLVVVIIHEICDISKYGSVVIRQLDITYCLRPEHIRLKGYINKNSKPVKAYLLKSVIQLPTLSVTKLQGEAKIRSADWK